MPRSRILVASRGRRRNIIKHAIGFWGRRKNVYTIAKNAVEKGLQYQYRDRKTRKRNFRKLWIIRINAAARLNGTTYARLIHGLKKKEIVINRKILADIAVRDPETFSAIVKDALN
ncbi:MAG: 50S ribosomal protein L20 [Balneolaceae bacterium]